VKEKSKGRKITYREPMNHAHSPTIKASQNWNPNITPGKKERRPYMYSRETSP